MAVVSDSDIAGLAIRAGFPADQIATAVAVALAESGGRSDAEGHNTNGSTDYGLWQINTIHGVTRADMFDPAKNAAKAYYVFHAAKDRWTPWSVFKNGRYRPFLARGAVAARAPTNSGGTIPATNDPSQGGAASVNPFALLFDPGLWLRIGMALLGAVLLLIGTVKLTGIGRTAIRIAKTVVPAAKALPI